VITLVVMAQRVISMDVRLVAALSEPGPVANVSALCARLGISRQTFYVYRRRFRAEGVLGLLPRSRRPVGSPGRTRSATEERIVGLRAQLARDGLDNGAKSIFYRLCREGMVPVPAVSTIHRVLVRHGLVTAQPQKRPRSSWRSFEYSAPNGCWQMDATAWTLAGGRQVMILRILDDHSRAMLGWRVARSENAADAWACLAEAIRRHGRPALVLTDNSSAFTGTLVRGELAKLAVPAIHASSRHPQTCGKKEREHSTLKRWLRAQTPAGDAAQLSVQLAAYDAIYNDQRPHQALAGATPAERYAATAKTTPPSQPQQPRSPGTRARDELIVNAHGVLRMDGLEIQLGREWCHASVTTFRTGEQIAIFHRATLIRVLTVDPTRSYQALGRPNTGPRRKRVMNTSLDRTPPGLPRSPANAPSATSGQHAAPAAQRGRTMLTARTRGAH
jgi:transposase InsO family protein